jgi:hypothetical protein|tara:strand:- start:398 stop:592 length:195 start_codon:yes stop_codon:yes gene_type:complete
MTSPVVWFFFVLNLYTTGAEPDRKIAFYYHSFQECLEAQVHWSQAQFNDFRSFTIDFCKEEEEK